MALGSSRNGLKTSGEFAPHFLKNKMKTHNGHLRYLHIIGCIACCLAYFFGVTVYAQSKTNPTVIYVTKDIDTFRSENIHSVCESFVHSYLNRTRKQSPGRKWSAAVTSCVIPTLYFKVHYVIKQNGQSGMFDFHTSIWKEMGCPNDYKLVGEECIMDCKPPKKIINGQCKENNCPEKGTPHITDGPKSSENLTQREVNSINAHMAANFCENGCTVLLFPDECHHDGPPDSTLGYCHFKRKGKHMGSSCIAKDGASPAPPDMNPTPQPDGATPTPQPNGATPTPQPLPEPQNPTCEKGTCPGNVNGTDVCVPCTSTSKNETKKTTTEKDTIGDGKKDTKVEKEVTTNTVKNKDGTTTTITTTTTTTTKTNPDGTQTTETKKETEVENTGNEKFCSENPKSPLCEKKEDSFFHGSGCDSEPTCKGDAIQCAMVKYHHQNNCILTAQTEESQIYGNSKDEKDENLLASNPENETLQITLQQVTASQPNRLPYGSCPNSLNLTVSSTPFSFDISQICPYLEHMGNLLIAFALFASAFLLSRDF